MVSNFRANLSRKFSAVSALLRASHLSIAHKEKPVWLTNATVVRLKIRPLKEIVSQQFPLRTHHSTVTRGNNSFYQIINRKSTYNLCDTIEIRIFARNKMNESKSYGGDYFFAHIKSPEVLASAGPDGGIEDHKNGNYTARFKLRWTGTLQLSVKLMHSSEFISILRRARDYIHARLAFDGVFKKAGNISKVVPCHVTPFMFVKAWENGSGPGVVEFCNFTDPVSGAPWFCVKPENFPCSSYSTHEESFKRENHWMNLIPRRDWSLFKQ